MSFAPAAALRRLALFPTTVAIRGEGADARITIGGCDLTELAQRYGTPLYVYDQATMDNAVAAYRQALAHHYPAAAAITLAGKAFLSVAGAQWAERQQIWLDCTGAGELHIAHVAGFDRARVLVHGVNKSDEDLRAALSQASTIVVDNLSELERLSALLQTAGPSSLEVWLRVRPGVAVETHAYRQTGQEESKFGMSLAEAVDAVHHCQRTGLRLTGIHFHQGSHFHDVEPIGPGLDTVLDLLQELHSQSGWAPAVLSPGGGWGVAYHEDDLPHPSIEHYVAFIAHRLAQGCQERGLPLPRLQVEPGRSLVAQAGVALYRVGAVKQSANRRWLLIDGGMADNPRKALYGARYSALPVQAPARPTTGPVWVGGPYCESGDVLLEALPLPDMQPGELLAIPISGAYHLAMGSNYNGARKPAVIWLNQGQATLIQRRESLEDLVARDLPLP
jgi:diaminopimelate decarboxylase